MRNSTQNMGKGLITLQASIPQEELRVSRLYSAYAYYYAPSFVFNGESHSAWEVYYVNAGEVTVETDVTTYVLSKGQFLVHKPYEFHKVHANNVSCSVYVFSFDCDCEKLNLLTDKCMTANSYQSHMIMNIVDEGMSFLAGTNEIPALNENEKPEFACGQLTKLLLETFLIEAIRVQERNGEAQHKNDTLNNEKTLLQFAKNFMQENVCRKLTLEEISNNIGYSVPHLCSVFKKNIGTSVIQYFIDLRIKKAKELIAEGNMTLKEISEYMDFDTLQYFSTQFKKTTGITPSQYATIIKTKKYIIV
jgi:AraC-like DNA-binding protein